MLLINPPEPVGNPTGVANADVVNTFLEKVQTPACSKVNTRKKNQHTGDWTDERIELLKKLWADGLSATQIASEMGGTRNGILGKVWRLKLSRPKPLRVGLTIKRRRDGGTGALRSIELRAMTGRKALPKEAPAPADFLGIALEALQPNQCLNPRGEAWPYLFCGQPKRKGSSYCAQCHSVNWVAPR